MAGSPLYPNLIDRALRYLVAHREASEAELCAHLFGTRPGGTGGPWARLLAGVLAGDERFESRPDGRWALRGNARSTESLAELEFISLVVRTDGPKPWRHRIVELAAVRARGLAAGAGSAGNLVTGRWASVVQPGTRPRRLPAYLRESGLGPDDLEPAPAFGEVADDLLRFLGDCPLLGLDVGLAVAFLQFELRRLGRPSLTNPLIELAPLADLVLPPDALAGKPSLGKLARALGLHTADERRAASAAASAAEAGRRLLARADRQGLSGLPELLGLMGRESAAPAAALEAVRPLPLLNVATGRDLPETPGAYLLKDRDGQVLYVGKATSLRDRVSSYLTTDLSRSRKMAGLVEATDAVETLPTETELEAQLLEARLIAELRPRFNVQRRAGVDLVYLRRNPEAAEPRANGAPRRRTWASATTDPADDAIGPLAPAEARRLLKEARARFRLGGSRRGPGWRSRSREAWSWLAAEADRSPVVGDLTGADLRLFALLAPWPPRLGARGQAALAADDSESLAGVGPLLRGETRADAHAELPEALAPPTADDGCCEEPRTAPLRVVVVGRAGWLGSLTVGVGERPASEALSDEAAIASQLRELLAAAPSARPTALAELGLALRWGQRQPGQLLRLRDPEEGARALARALAE